MWRSLFLALFIVSCASATPTADDLVRDALAAESTLQTGRALELFLQVEQIRPEDAFVLQKIARQYSDSVVDTDDVAEKKQRAESALAYAKRAVALQPDNPVNVLSLAICHGTLGVYSDTRTKINYSRLVREEAERALQLDPDYAFAHHVLGRWNYEVASLGTMTRFVVKLVYGGLPEASYQEAVKQLQKAVELEPDVLVHRLELGFALRAADRDKEAKASFQKGLSMPSRDKHDEPAKQRAREALADMD